MDRRSLLGLAAGAVGGLAGCSAVGPFGGDSDGRGEGRRTPRETATATPTPDLPYASSDAAENLDRSRALRVRNERSRPAYVTVLVEDGNRTVFLDSRTVPAAGSVTHEGLVRRRGIYRLTAETADGVRAVRDWMVGESWGTGAVVRVRDDAVGLDQQGVCDPACPPMPSSGTAADLPARDPGADGPPASGGINLRNARASPARAGVVVDGPTRTLLDYRYRLPAGATVHVPAVRAAGTYDLSVRGPGGRFDAAWHVPEEQFPTVRIDGDGPAPACAHDRLRLTGIRNAARRSVRLAVRLLADGRTVAARTVDLAADAGRTGLGLRARGDALRVEAELASGASLAAEWALCPPGGLRLLVIGSGIYLLTGDRVVAAARS
ncbi:MAG: hypothetical protein ABEH40_09360 [Haloferacaceae archaeon]